MFDIRLKMKETKAAFYLLDLKLLLLLLLLLLACSLSISIYRSQLLSSFSSFFHSWQFSLLDLLELALCVLTLIS